MRAPQETSWTQGQVGPQVPRPRGQGKREVRPRVPVRVGCHQIKALLSTSQGPPAPEPLLQAPHTPPLSRESEV